MKKRIFILGMIAAAIVSAITGCQKKPIEVRVETESEHSTETEKEILSPTSSPTPIPTSTPKPTPTFIPDKNPQEEFTESELSNPVYETEEFESEDTVEIMEQADYADQVFIGDERFCSLQSIADMSNAEWECSELGDYTWMAEEAFPAMESRIGDGTKVIISFGLNDLGNAAAYAALINNQARVWEEKGASIYFVSVGPVSEDSSISNQDIMDFNTYMYQNLSVSFIDMYNWLVRNGFETIDGQVYSDITNISIYGYLSEILSAS